MEIIGLTGSFGTGKTFAASIFKSLGAEVLDADKFAHDAIKKGTKAYKNIVAAFGGDILDKKRSIDRRRLGGIVFKDKEALKILNSIVHPEVIRIITERIAARGKKGGVIVIDAPLFFEANLEGLADRLVVVKASRENQIKRCSKKFCIDKEGVLNRIKSQIPMHRKIGMADFVIDNDGTKAETRKQVQKIWGKVWR